MIRTDVVAALSAESFDDIVAREFCRTPDQMLVALAADPRVRRLVVVDPWRSWIVDLLRRRSLKTVESCHINGREVIRIRPRRIGRTLPRDPEVLAKLSRRYAKVVGAALRPSGSTVLISFNPFVAAWANPQWCERTVYFGRDDFSAYPPMRPLWPAVREAYRAIADRVDDIFVVSDELRARICPRAVVAPNGVAAGTWIPDRRSADLPGGISRPYAVYAGTIDARIDLRLVQAIVRSPDVTRLVMVGPVLDGDIGTQLAAIENVDLVGRMTQEQLATVVQNADIAVLPHVIDRLTTAMSPLKLYEYLAGGLPIVATELPPLQGHGRRVHLCSREDQWAGSLAAATQQGVLGPEERAAVVEEYAWSRRLAPILDVVVGVARSGAK